MNMLKSTVNSRLSICKGAFWQCQEQELFDEQDSFFGHALAKTVSVMLSLVI